MSITHQFPIIQRCRFALTYEVGTLIVISPAFIDHWHVLKSIGGKVIALLLIAILWNSTFSNVFNQLLKYLPNVRLSSRNYKTLYTICFIVGLTVLSTPVFCTMIPLNLPEYIITSLAFSVLSYLYAISTNTLYRKHLS